MGFFWGEEPQCVSSDSSLSRRVNLFSRICVMKGDAVRVSKIGNGENLTQKPFLSSPHWQKTRVKLPLITQLVQSF